MKTKIGAYEARTKFPELLRQVKAGKQFTITNRGQAIADLLPSEALKPKDKSAAVEKFKTFMWKNPALTTVNVKELVAEGRP